MAGLSDPDPSLLAEREKRIAEHMTKRPPWWRVFARNNWKLELGRLQAMDVSAASAMLRKLYSPHEIEQMAAQPNPVLALVRMEKERREHRDQRNAYRYERLRVWTDKMNSKHQGGGE